MSKERELIKDMKILLECTSMGGLQRNADVLIGRAIELLAKPEPDQEGVYQKLLRIEDGIEVEIQPSELWQDGYETGRKDPQKREPLSDEVIREFANDSYFICNDAFKKGVRWAEQQHKIGENCEQS